MKNIFPMKLESVVLVVTQSILVLFVVVAFTMETLAKFSSGATLSVGRGEYSLTWLLSSCAAITGIYVMIIQMSGITNGRKMVLLLVDFLLIAYLFFVSDWFVNSVVYAALQMTARH